MTEIHVIVGAQYGSEAKGHVTAQVIRKYQHHNQRHILNIRVAGPNAGHTVVDRNGNRIALRTIPVGGALVDTNVNDLVCYLAPGSEIQMSVLQHEIDLLRSLGHHPTIYVSGEATLLTDQHIEIEQNADMHQRLGSTAKGIGAARADRIMRTAQRVKDDPNAVATLAQPGVHLVEDDLQFVEDWLSNGDPIIVEGTQGYGLGLHTGHYPKCTSSDTRALDFLAMAGINPWIHDLTVWACARVYPIRVAGDSGYMLGETTWEELGLPAEQTTVTHKTRRVGAWDRDLVKRAVAANGGWPIVQIALTMADQKIPQVEGWDGNLLDYQDIDGYHDLERLIEQVAWDTDTNVGLVTTSDRTAVWL